MVNIKRLMLSIFMVVSSGVEDEQAPTALASYEDIGARWVESESDLDSEQEAVVCLPPLRQQEVGSESDLDSEQEAALGLPPLGQQEVINRFEQEALCKLTAEAIYKHNLAQIQDPDLPDLAVGNMSTTEIATLDSIGHVEPLGMQKIAFMLNQGVVSFHASHHTGPEGGPREAAPASLEKRARYITDRLNRGNYRGVETTICAALRESFQQDEFRQAVAIGYPHLFTVLSFAELQRAGV